MKKLFILLSLISLPIIAAESPYENLTQYFNYLPNAVHKNWTPYKANADYEVLVQFSVKKNGDITEPIIISSTNKNSNTSVINAVRAGAPYAPLPDKYPSESVKTQIQLKYIK